jgi:hypothetical protein
MIGLFNLGVKRSTVFQFVLLCSASVLILRGNAASAVAWDGHGHLGTGIRSSVNEAKNRALDLCRGAGGVDPKILAASGAVGYGAIAVARRGTGWIIGVSLGRRSATESEILAKEQCLKGGGTNPKVRWGFRG